MRFYITSHFTFFFFATCHIQWRTQKFFVRGADDVFNHIFERCGRVFCLKYTLIFFSRGAAAHFGKRLGPPMVT
ncbi:hypothetical protein Hanom_Chr02g00100491 [Helianthus anomalus]